MLFLRSFIFSLAGVPCAVNKFAFSNMVTVVRGRGFRDVKEGQRRLGTIEGDRRGSVEVAEVKGGSREVGGRQRREGQAVVKGSYGL